MLFVVIGEYGEYEQRSEVLCGVFSSLGEAEAAIARSDIDREPVWRTWEAWEARGDAYLATLEPDRVIESSLFADGIHKCYREEDYVEAKKRAGPEPDISVEFDTVYIYSVHPGRWRWGWNKVREICVKDQK